LVFFGAGRSDAFASSHCGSSASCIAGCAGGTDNRGGRDVRNAAAGGGGGVDTRGLIDGTDEEIAGPP
jgi:hypothetical protein